MQGFTKGVPIDTDGALTLNSDLLVPSQKAVATYAVKKSLAVNTTAPLTGGGNLSTDRTLVIPAADAGTDGYLKATDFTTFAAKVSTTRSVNTTAPVTGGGDLSSDRTIAVSDFVASGVNHARGTVPDPGAVAGTTKFLREDATWAVSGEPAANTMLRALNFG